MHFSEKKLWKEITLKSKPAGLEKKQFDSVCELLPIAMGDL